MPQQPADQHRPDPCRARYTRSARRAEAPVVAISPVVGGASLKGPTDKMLADLGMEVSAAQVARLYSDFADIFILDVQDEAAKPEIESWE